MKKMITAFRHTPWARLTAVVGLVVYFFAIGATAASAAPIFKAPFECGTTWGASTYSGHGNAADFNMPGTADGDAGKPVLASAAGSVVAAAFHSIGGNYVVVDHGSGSSTYYGHLQELRVTRGQAVGTGQLLGTVGRTGSATGAHLHYEQRVNGAGQLPIRFDGAAIAIGSAPPGPTFTSTNCSASVSEGSFVANRGHVFRIAGGAPLYVSTWTRFGGSQPTTTLSDAAFDALPQYPRDGTLVSGQAPGSADHGTVYVVAGGAPVYVSSYAHIGGDRGTVGIDLSAIDNAGGGGVWSHLRQQPADGTLVSGQAPGSADHGTVYVVAGGAPVYVSSYAHIGGDRGTVGIDLAAIDNAGRGGVWNHLRYRPADDTVLEAAGKRYRVRAGAPIPTSLTTGGVQVDPEAIKRAGEAGRWSHLARVPSRSLRVTATAVQGGSALRVQVRPGSSRRNYEFRVQSRVRGHWATVKRATTTGSGDMRVLDLPGGVYRVALVSPLSRIVTKVVRLRR